MGEAAWDFILNAIFYGLWVVAIIPVFKGVSVRVLQIYWSIFLRFCPTWENLERNTKVTEVSRTYVDATFFRFRPEVAQWCGENFSHAHGVAPSFSDPRWTTGPTRRIWFTNKNEAALFRVRWL